MIATVQSKGWSGSGFADALSGGGAVVIGLGGRAELLHDRLADLDGDTISEFGPTDTLEITGSLIGRANLAVTIGAGGSSFQLAGDFMMVTRGTGDTAQTTVTFWTFLPSLQEGGG